MTKKKILFQIALDILTREETQRILSPELLEVVEIVEVGTPLIVRYGLSIVNEIRRWTDGKKLIFADTKIVDAGGWETKEAILAGADIVSVLAGASSYTLEEVRDVSQTNEAGMVVDIIDLSLADLNKIDFLYTLNPEYLCIHLSSDVVKKGGSLLEFSKQLPFLLTQQLPLMVAGGINLFNLQDIVKHFQPAVVVAGSSLSGAEDPTQVALKMRRIIDENIFS